MSKTVVCFSGGLESSTVLCSLAQSGSEVHAVHTRQGSSFSCLLDAILCYVQVAKLQKLGDSVEFVEMNMAQVYRNLKTEGQFYVPGYMMLTYLAALSYADKIKCYGVYTGEQLAAFNPNDPDNDPELTNFMELMGRTTEEASTRARSALADLYGKFYYPYDSDGSARFNFQFVDPLHYLSKAEGLRWGMRIGTPFELTRTCKDEDIAKEFIQATDLGTCTQELLYHDVEYIMSLYPDVLMQVRNLVSSQPLHCGKTDCHFCNERRMAFRKSEISDLTIYAR